MLRQKYFYRKDIKTREKPKSKEKIEQYDKMIKKE